jgi:hypothetical protein
MNPLTIKGTLSFIRETQNIKLAVITYNGGVITNNDAV